MKERKGAASMVPEYAIFQNAELLTSMSMNAVSVDHR